MSWQPNELMNIKRDFVQLALQEGANRGELRRRFGIAPNRLRGIGALCQRRRGGAFVPRSRKPYSSPARTLPDMEMAVTDLRGQHPSWGGRKIVRRLAELGLAQVPPPSTIAAILHRHGLITPQASQAAQRAVADRLQGRLCHRPGALLPVDLAGRPLALQPGATGVPQRSGQQCAATPSSGVCALRAAGAPQCGQWRALGQPAPGRPWPERAQCLADSSGHPGQSQCAVPPADQGQDRTLSPLAQG